MKNNNQMVMLRKMWLVIIITVTVLSSVGSAFLSYSTFREKVKANAIAIEKHNQTINENQLAIVRMETKLDVIINGLGLKEKE